MSFKNLLKTFFFYIKNFFPFVVEVLGLKAVYVLISSMLLIIYLDLNLQETNHGYSIFIGFCLIISILAFNNKTYKEKQIKQD